MTPTVSATGHNRASHLFNATSQLRTTVMGAAVAPRRTRSSESAGRRPRHTAASTSTRNVPPRAAGELRPKERHWRSRLPASASPFQPQSAPPSNVRPARHKTVPCRPAATAAGSRLPSMTPATGPRTSKRPDYKSAMSWIHSTDMPATSRRGRTALRSRRRVCARQGTACGRPPSGSAQRPSPVLGYWIS
jgi:hypothetical protein